MDNVTHEVFTISGEISYDEAVAVLRHLASAPLADRPELTPLTAALAEAEKEPSPQQDVAPPASGNAASRTWSESTFRSLVESAPDPLVFFDHEGTITFINARTEQLFGYSRSELLGQSLELLLPELLRDRSVGDYFSSSGDLPRGQTLELCGRRSDGRDFPVAVRLSPLETEEGRLVTATIRDITDRKRLEARYRNLVEGIPAVTFLAALDEGKNELYVSPQIEQLLGFTPKQWLEDPVLWYTQLHPDDRERWHVEFAHTCATAAPFRSEYRFIARDGRVVWVQGEAKVVRDGAGRPLFLQGVAFDITERKAAEEVLRRSHDELEDLVQQRTAELARVNHELQEAVKQKESLLKEIHHRVKNNLQVISSLLNLQSATVKEPQTLQAIRESRDRVKSMALIHEKLYQSTELARIDFGPYIRDLAAHLFRSYGAAASGVSLRTDVDDASLTLDVAIPCGLIVTELISNCLKHAFPQPGGGEITVSLHADHHGGWTLVVKDDGIGFPPEIDLRGTDSLGLQLVSTLVDQLDGTIDVRDDGGACFELHFVEPPAN